MTVSQYLVVCDSFPSPNILILLGTRPHVRAPRFPAPQLPQGQRLQDIRPEQRSHSCLNRWVQGTVVGEFSDF